MKPEDKICYCYDVSLRKLANFARREKPARPSQMSGCLGAGTGCGWCIPILKRIQEAARDDATDQANVELTPEEYARERSAYIKEKKPRNRFD